jgi:hypothetical protein
MAMRPHMAADVPERFCRANILLAKEDRLIYRPAVLATVACHYVRASAGLDTWSDLCWLAMPAGRAADEEPWEANPWADALHVSAETLQLTSEPEPGVPFEELPSAMLAAKNYKRWQTRLKDYVYRHQRMRLFTCPELKTVSAPGEDEYAARLSLEQRMREARDAQREKLQAKYAAMVHSLEAKIVAAQERVSREGGQFYESALNLGQTVLGMLIGNKRARTSATVRGLGKAARQRSESQSAQESLRSLQDERQRLIHAAEADIEALSSRFNVHALTLMPLEVPCRKADLRIDLLALVWIPWAVGPDGQARMPLVQLPPRSTAETNRIA